MYAYILSLSSALDGGRWSTPRSGLFIPGKETQYPLYRRLSGHQSRSERVRKISTQPGFDPQTFQPVANLYTDCTFPAHCIEKYFFYQGATAPKGPRTHYWGFTITLRHTTVGRTPLDEWSARRRDFCRSKYNTHKRRTSMLPKGFEPTIPASKRPQTHALDRATTGTGRKVCYKNDK